MRWSTSGLEAQERKLPNRALRSHGTGDGGKGLVAHSGAKLAVSDMTSSGEATETTGIRLEQREMVMCRRCGSTCEYVQRDDLEPRA